MPFSMAFQPIVDLGAGRVRAYEALVRGPRDEPAATVLAQLTPANIYAFDQAARVRAIELAAQIGVATRNASVSINFRPGAMYRPQSCVRPTLAAARRTGFPPDRIVFELTEDERVGDFGFLREIFEVYRANQFSTAIDDFGAGYAGLTLLAEYRPDWVKLDMALIRGVDGDMARRAIVAGVVGICSALSIGLIAEGVETRAELDALRSLGVTVFQGYLFAKPAFEQLPDVTL